MTFTINVYLKNGKCIKMNEADGDEHRGKHERHYSDDSKVMAENTFSLVSALKNASNIELKTDIDTGIFGIVSSDYREYIFEFETKQGARIRIDGDIDYKFEYNNTDNAVWFPDGYVEEDFLKELRTALSEYFQTHFERCETVKDNKIYTFNFYEK